MHDFADINAGAVIGVVVAVVCYFVNYPGLTSKHCDLPRMKGFKQERNTEREVLFNHEDVMLS